MIDYILVNTKHQISHYNRSQLSNMADGFQRHYVNI